MSGNTSLVCAISKLIKHLTNSKRFFIFVSEEKKKNFVADQDKFKHKEYLRILKMLAGGYI